MQLSHSVRHYCLFILGIDAILHVNPFIANKGLLMIYNPTSTSVSQNLTVPLYYTGVDASVNVSQEAQTGKVYTLTRDYTITLSITMAAKTVTWFLFT